MMKYRIRNKFIQIDTFLTLTGNWDQLISVVKLGEVPIATCKETAVLIKKLPTDPFHDIEMLPL